MLKKKSMFKKYNLATNVTLETSVDANWNLKSCMDMIEMMYKNTFHKFHIYLNLITIRILSRAFPDISLTII